MHRAPLIHLLEKHKAFDENEYLMRILTLAFIKDQPNCFERSLLQGHVTASGWVTDKTGQKVLLMHHKKLGRWFQPGGHCDGNPDSLVVASAEVQEETGVKTLQQMVDGIFDVDVHYIPERNQVPGHLHYDIRYWMVANPFEKVVANSESNAVKWISLNEIARFNETESMLRMARKVGSFFSA